MSFRKLKTAAIGIVDLTPRLDLDAAVRVAGDDLEARLRFAILLW
jgi:hypothetical protein